MAFDPNQTNLAGDVNYRDFGNGLQYDPKSGAVKMVDETGKVIYSYAPSSNGSGVSMIGDKMYPGQVNPMIFGQITDQQTSDSYNKYFKHFQPAIDKYQNPDTYSEVFSHAPLTQEVLDAYVNADVYSQATAGASDSDRAFFDTLKQMAAQQDQAQISSQTSDANVTAVMNNPDLTDSVKQAILGDSYPKQQDTSGALQTPVILNSSAVQKWIGALPDQLQGTTNTLQQQQAPAVSQPGTPPVALRDTGNQSIHKPGTPPVAPVEQPQTTAPSSTTDTSTQPDYAGFLQAVYGQVQPYLSSQYGGPSSTPAPDPYASSAFNIGGAQTKEPTLAKQSASPDFSIGGYNPQTSSTDLSTGSSGKADSSTSQSSSKGMATGQFGSK